MALVLYVTMWPQHGVVRDSTLNSSKYFHVTEGLVPDVMHNVLEGCAPYILKELLKYLDQNNIITVPLDARNKPTQIPGSTFSSSDHTLKQKGILTYNNISDTNNINNVVFSNL